MIEISLILAVASMTGTCIHALINMISNRNKSLSELLTSATEVIYERNYSFIFENNPNIPISASFINEVKMESLISQTKNYINDRSCILNCYSKNGIDKRIRDRINYLHDKKKHHSS